MNAGHARYRDGSARAVLHMRRINVINHLSRFAGRFPALLYIYMYSQTCLLLVTDVQHGQDERRSLGSERSSNKLILAYSIHHVIAGACVGMFALGHVGEAVRRMVETLISI